jgi:flagellar biosynthesis protein FlhB
VNAPPSARRLREARARGEVAHSSLLSAAAAVGAAALALALTARPAAGRLIALAQKAWSGGGDARDILPSLAALALPIVLAAAVGAFVAGLAQTRALFAWGALGRHGPHNDGEPLAATSWAAAAALVLVLVGGGRVLVASLGRADGALVAATATLAALGSLTARAVVVIALAGLGDFAWRRARLQAALSMTRAEVERERREDEGDPRLRAEQRRRQRALARDPLVDELARAELVVTAEGVAVALRLVDGAAQVAASAAERLRAQRLSEIARRLGVAVRADDELAAALQALATGAPVPPPWQPRAIAALRAIRR